MVKYHRRLLNNIIQRPFRGEEIFLRTDFRVTRNYLFNKYAGGMLILLREPHLDPRDQWRRRFSDPKTRKNNIIDNVIMSKKFTSRQVNDNIDGILLKGRTLSKLDDFF